MTSNQRRRLLPSLTYTIGLRKERKEEVSVDEWTTTGVTGAAVFQSVCLADDAIFVVLKRVGN